MNTSIDAAAILGLKLFWIFICILFIYLYGKAGYLSSELKNPFRHANEHLVAAIQAGHRAALACMVVSLYLVSFYWLFPYYQPALPSPSTQVKRQYQQPSLQ